MSDPARELRDAQAWLAKECPETAFSAAATTNGLIRLASVICRVSAEQLRDTMSEFHNEAGRLPFFGDKDIGALILEAAADGVSNPEIRKFLYREARLRAIWCAQAASGGGEGIARSGHIKSLENKIQSND